MRTIKFRGKRLDNQGWAYGYYAMWQNDSTIFPSSSIGKPYKVDKSTVGQFTGLYDKNGKEIYEGDIMCWPDYEGKKFQTRWVVEWNDKRSGWSDWSPKEKAEVIGNIYENPELL